MKTIKVLALSLILFAALPSSAWRLYIMDTTETIGSIYVYYENNDRKNIIEDRVLLNKDYNTYSLKPDNIEVPSEIGFDYDKNKPKFPFEPGYLYAISGKRTTNWYITKFIDNRETEEYVMQNDGSKWSVTLQIEGNEEYKLLFKFLASGDYIREGDILYAKNGEPLSLTNPTIDLVSSITEGGGMNISTSLLRPGEYKFTFDALYETLTIEPLGSTEPVEINITEGDKQLNYFPSDPNVGTTVKGIFKAEGLNLEDFEYCFSPAFDPVLDSDHNDYRLPAYLYEHMTSVKEQNPDLSVDGYYTSDDKIKVKITQGEDSEFDLFIQSLPCSGLYNLTITPKEGADVTFDKTTIEVPVYPNIFNQYKIHNLGEGEFPININGIPVTKGTDGYTIAYPLLKDEEGKVTGIWNPDGLAKAEIYTPGLYLPGPDDHLYIWIDYSSNTDKMPESLDGVRVSEAKPRRLANDKYQEYTGSIDLSAIKDLYENQSASSMRLHFVVAKNGVETLLQGTDASEQSVAVSFSDQFPTAVEIVEAECISPVYYNLQGQRVEYPAHGLYIRLIGTKAEKILLP